MREPKHNHMEHTSISLALIYIYMCVCAYVHMYTLHKQKHPRYKKVRPSRKHQLALIKVESVISGASQGSSFLQATMYDHLNINFRRFGHSHTYVYTVSMVSTYDFYNPLTCISQKTGSHFVKINGLYKNCPS